MAKWLRTMRAGTSPGSLTISSRSAAVAAHACSSANFGMDWRNAPTTGATFRQIQQCFRQLAGLVVGIVVAQGHQHPERLHRLLRTDGPHSANLWPDQGV